MGREVGGGVREGRGWKGKGASWLDWRWFFCLLDMGVGGARVVVVRLHGMDEARSKKQM